MPDVIKKENFQNISLDLYLPRSVGVYNLSKSKYMQTKITAEDVGCILYNNPCNFQYIQRTPLLSLI